MLGRITKTVSDVTVGTVIVLVHVALHARQERAAARAALAGKLGDPRRDVRQLSPGERAGARQGLATRW